MNASERWQELVAGNLSTASTPGSRQREISFSAIQAGLANTDASNNYVIPAASATVNFQQGEMKSTGGKMDFGLEGKGFFTVQMPDGSKGYTRDGEFKLNSQGQMVTKQGFPVMTDSGPLTFDPNNTSPIDVSASGEVSQGIDIKGTMQITEFGNPKALTMTNGSYFAADTSAQPRPATTTGVRQGFVEISNTSPTLAMANLITSMRMFETNQKVMQMQNDRMNKAITQLSGTA